MSKNARKTFVDVRSAFEDRSILRASRTELEEFLAAAACERSDDEATRAQAREMSLAMRQLIIDRRGAELGRPSIVAIAAVFSLGAALAWCGTQAFFSRRASAATASEFNNLTNTPMTYVSANDPRTTLTIAELATKAPSLRRGTVQAWWAGEQARQVQRLEAQAKRQALAGDREGAARSVRRADQIRNSIPALAENDRRSTP